MSRLRCARLAILLAASAAAVFAGVAIQELSYVSSHPYRYGPAKVVAWAAGGGVLLSAAVVAVAYAVVKS